ncbi:hypothetical protein TVAG_050960 [Trichomonas vaginalis G3]|uniref:DUF3447 domain-containing protein n=1 Tax=Trichomonas vaginalis (strain ATCC PRA-98 / G3) TaxID=412133 RepID=A2EEQ5_TRIV3|nr:hypothetical protein TVAG_050960 [Trichomonas vaginalis G3]|eukprot:XP_001321084.1 hypothetical protein [Trichomonas vaginalis G3]
MLVTAKSTKQYDELMTQYKDYIDTIDSLYKLNTNEEEKISDIYSKIKANLIETNIITPSRVIKIISNACCYNSRFKQSYISLAIKFFNEYHPTSIVKVPIYFDYFVFKEHGIIFSEKNKYKISTYKESELYKAIIEDDAKLMSSIIDNEGFDSRKFIKSILNPNPLLPGFLFELVCYHGAVNCFKLLITKYHPRISQFCLEYSFRSGIPDIMNECLKYQTPDYRYMMHAVKSHNIDFIGCPKVCLAQT